MGLNMAQYRSAGGQYKEEPVDPHHPHQQPQGQAPHLQQHSRPSSIVHQQHHTQSAQQPQPPQQQHSSSYSSSHPVYQQHSQSSSHAQELPYYAHPSPYSTPGATSGYTSAGPTDTSDMMAATMPRPPYPPMSYHTPQSNSPASVASPSGHDQQRGLYGQPSSQLHQQNLYYSQQPQYSSMPTQAAQSPYAAHTQQSHQSMTSQPGMMMSHPGSQHQMAQHPSQHNQAAMTSSPRHPKIEAHSMPPQIQRSSASSSLGPSPAAAQNGATLPAPGGAAAAVNPNAAPGPIPATTPLVVKQDQNGVQWIAFEYSRDRVKMEYTIRCDVESVNTDELTPEFKTENCVYPRACCPKDQYRGNRLQYETECNTVGWALAQLNPPLRGKRGLIQRAVDSWRNSNQDPRLRSRRVRRMAKMNNRKAVQSAPHPTHLPGPSGPAGMPGPGSMGPGGMGKAGMNMGSQMHHPHHQDGATGGGDEVGDNDYMDSQHHHHHQQSQGGGPGTDDVRHAQVFTQYGHYGSGAPAVSAGAAGGMPGMHHPSHAHAGAVAASASSSTPRRGGADVTAAAEDEPSDLFPDMPEAKKRKFILVEDTERQTRLRVRVTLDGVDTHEIPDSFRKGSSVFPRSWFPREMQSPPPSATGSKFFPDDLSDDGEDDGATETESGGGRRLGGSRRARAGGEGGASGSSAEGGTVMVKVPMGKGDGEVAIPRVRKSMRGKEVRLNELGFRMAWLQSRVFAGRTVFLQRALDCYRNKTQGALESIMQDVRTVAPHYETRVGKRRFTERLSRKEKKTAQETS